MCNVNEIIIDNNAANFIAMYESVCGRGRIRFIEDFSEKTNVKKKYLTFVLGYDIIFEM